MAVYGLGLSICQTARRLSPIDRAGDSRATSSATPELSNARFRACAGVMAQLGHTVRARKERSAEQGQHCPRRCAACHYGPPRRMAPCHGCHPPSAGVNKDAKGRSLNRRCRLLEPIQLLLEDLRRVRELTLLPPCVVCSPAPSWTLPAPTDYRQRLFIVAAKLCSPQPS
jgi:hypothetical protein